MSNNYSGIGRVLWGTVLVACLMISGCNDSKNTESTGNPNDRISLIDGLEYEVLIKWGDEIKDNRDFGYDNDFIAYLPDSDKKGALWVSHEDINTLFISGYEKEGDIARHRDHINKELFYSGGSLIKVEKSWGSWKFKKDPFNKRITGAQQVQINWPTPIFGRNTTFGTAGLSAGGVTPWGTVLVGERDYRKFYGDYNELGDYEASEYQLESFTGNPTTHYGWMVEIDPYSNYQQKHIAMGRFAHGGVAITSLTDGRVVVYSTDNRPGGSIYKFVADEPGNLNTGKLYVANITTGTWNAVNYDLQVMQKAYASETEMLIKCRDAVKLVAGSGLDNPAGVAIDEVTGEVVVALNGKTADNPYGSIIRIKEAEEDYGASKFSLRPFITGGNEPGFACPDQVVFDQKGNLWFTSDIASNNIGQGNYQEFSSNGLFVYEGSEEGKSAIRVASAPVDAAFGAPCFAPDQEAMFVSVKHPGERSKSSGYTSHWPSGEGTPKPAVIVLRGDFLSNLTGSE